MCGISRASAMVCATEDVFVDVGPKRATIPSSVFVLLQTKLR